VTNAEKRILSMGAGVIAVTLGGPRMLAAQAPGAAVSEAPDSGIAVLAIFGALLVVLGAGVKLYDVKRRRDEQGLQLQARVSDALLDDPETARLPLAATVHVPFWRPATARVVVSGRAPTLELREKALRLVLQQVLAAWPGAKVEDRTVVVPETVHRAA
jgi:hypothetical protein